LAVNADGFTVTSAPIVAEDRVWTVAISDVRLTSDDPWLRVKTTQRALYDTARAALPDGVDEMIFLNERDELCEGTITNIFAERDDVLVTPSLSSGVLPGILRQTLICSKRATVGKLTIEELRAAPNIYVGNSLRGLIKARLL
jgi:4-amino-4-deoxychorismate lyase